MCRPFDELGCSSESQSYSQGKISDVAPINAHYDAKIDSPYMADIIKSYKDAEEPPPKFFKKVVIEWRNYNKFLWILVNFSNCE